MYPSIGAPPSFVGADQVIVTEPSPGTGLTLVTTPGTSATGATLFEEVEGDESPMAFVATTAKVYEVLLTSPETVQVVPVVVHVAPPGVAVTV
jgi:hypothetical protein